MLGALVSLSLAGAFWEGKGWFQTVGAKQRMWSPEDLTQRSFSAVVLYPAEAGRMWPLSVLLAVQQPMSVLVFTLLLATVLSGCVIPVNLKSCFSLQVQLRFRTPEGVIFLWLINLETRSTAAQPLNYIYV